jgi:hypothetical protein
MGARRPIGRGRSDLCPDALESPRQRPLTVGVTSLSVCGLTTTDSSPAITTRPMTGHRRGFLAAPVRAVTTKRWVVVLVRLRPLTAGRAVRAGHAAVSWVRWSRYSRPWNGIQAHSPSGNPQRDRGKVETLWSAIQLDATTNRNDGLNWPHCDGGNATQPCNRWMARPWSLGRPAGPSPERIEV